MPAPSPLWQKVEKVHLLVIDSLVRRSHEVLATAVAAKVKASKHAWFYGVHDRNIVLSAFHELTRKRARGEPQLSQPSLRNAMLKGTSAFVCDNLKQDPIKSSNSHEEWMVFTKATTEVAEASGQPKASAKAKAKAKAAAADEPIVAYMPNVAPDGNVSSGVPPSPAEKEMPEFQVRHLSVGHPSCLLPLWSIFAKTAYYASPSRTPRPRQFILEPE